MSPSKISLKSTRKRLKIPIKKPPNPVTPKGGMSGFDLSKTKFKPKVAAVKRPQIEPKITLLFGKKLIKENKKDPHLIIADTIKGKGISFMENVTRWHNTMPNEKEIEIARKNLEVNCINE